MKEQLDALISEQSEWLQALALRVWENPEPSDQETFASSFLGQALADRGFCVRDGIAGLPTAFCATWGSGRPRIGFLMEYDALPGLSQQAVPYQSPIKDLDHGHGCGHNLLGVAALGAGIALQKIMSHQKLPGTVMVFGCPSEEIMHGKIAMAKANVFDDLDIALSWHPGDSNCASEMSYQAMMSLDYRFKGKASHAAMAPEEGCSALDSVEFMNIGANYLREHVAQGTQLHYVITDGGKQPNIVPDTASVWYFLRAKTQKDLRFARNRLDAIAKGAAMMAGTAVEIDVRTSCKETLIIREVVDAMEDVMRTIVPPPVWTEEEKQFARQLQQQMGFAQQDLRETYGEDALEHPLHDAIVPSTGTVVDILGSSDISDVSWRTPTGMLFAACYPKGTPNHTWAVTSCSGMGIGIKGMLYATRVLAQTGLKLLREPETMKNIRTAFDREIGKRGVT